jgi:hypothetical protein
MTAAARQCNFTGAVDAGLANLALASAIRRGGLVLDLLIAVVIEGIGIDDLRKIRNNLDVELATRLANALLMADAAREATDDIFARDRRWDELVPVSEEDLIADFDSFEDALDDADELDEGWKPFIFEAVRAIGELPREEFIHMTTENRLLAKLRLLAIELALAAYHSKAGSLPPDLAVLVPDFIVAIPLDPFSGGDFKYRQLADGFALYSGGPTLTDNGGLPGGWFDVLQGHADLFVDEDDYNVRDACDPCGDGGCTIDACSNMFTRAMTFFRRLLS